MLDVVKVTGSDEFREAVMMRINDGKDVYARKPDSLSPAYRIVSGGELHRLITLGDLFGNHYAPVNLEIIATALDIAREDGDEQIVEVFTL